MAHRGIVDFYFGEKVEVGACKVFADLIWDEGVWEKKHPVKHIKRHSPDGMQWGYGGSGPADCALSILTHFTTHDSPEFKNQVELLYQRFKFDFIAPAGNSLHIDRDAIFEWMTAHTK
jgi:hypothetical protein